MKKVADCTARYYRDRGYNCAETVLCAANDAWELHLDASAMRAMGGFGGGMGVRNVCGAVSGGIAALSYHYVEVTGHQSPLLMAKVRLFMNTVRERLGDEKCAELGPRYRSEDEGCLPTVRLVAEILDEVAQTELEEPAHRARRIKAKKLRSVLGESDWIVLDTRRDPADGPKIPGALSVPAALLDETEDGIRAFLRENHVTPETNVVLYDKIMKDACPLTEYLRARGYEKLYYFDGKLWDQSER